MTDTQKAKAQYRWHEVGALLAQGKVIQSNNTQYRMVAIPGAQIAQLVEQSRVGGGPHWDVFDQARINHKQSCALYGFPLGISEREGYHGAFLA